MLKRGEPSPPSPESKIGISETKMPIQDGDLRTTCLKFSDIFFKINVLDVFKTIKNKTIKKCFKDIEIKHFKKSTQTSNYWTIQIISQMLAQAACVRHACLRAPCVAWPLFSPSFSLSFSPLSPSSAFDPLRGISRVRNNFSPNILA